MNKNTETEKWHTSFRRHFGLWQPRDVIMLVLVGGLLYKDQALSASVVEVFRRVVAILQPLTPASKHERQASSDPAKD
jgi:hypothetical protein